MLACIKSASAHKSPISITIFYHQGKFSRSICHINAEVHLFAVMIGATAHHMTESLDTLICIKVQHHIELTRTKIMIDTHIPLPKVDLQ